MSLTTYQFSIVRFVPDIARDEAANLGVIVVDDIAGVSGSTFLRSVRGKVEALAPGLNMAAVTEVVERLRGRASSAYQTTFAYPDDARIRTSAQLRTLAGAMKNQIQMSEPRPYRATSLSAAATELYQELVQPVGGATESEPPRDEAMSLRKLRDLIWRTVRAWGELVSDQSPTETPPQPGVVQIARGALERGPGARHYADFWLQIGNPVAALVAIPADPDEHHVAWARRDAMPTIVADFRRVNKHFHAVAVLPPNGRQPTLFEVETRRFLEEQDGVIVVHADELSQLRERIIPYLPSSLPAGATDASPR